MALFCDRWQPMADPDQRPIGSDPKAASPSPVKRVARDSSVDHRLASTHDPNSDLPLIDARGRSTRHDHLSSAACPSEALAIPDEAQPYSELGWMDTFEELSPELQDKIIKSWNESRLSVFPPDARRPGADLMMAMVALKQCKSDTYPNTAIFQAAVRAVQILPKDHASFRTLSHGLEATIETRGYP